MSCASDFNLAWIFRGGHLTGAPYRAQQAHLQFRSYKDIHTDECIDYDLVSKPRAQVKPKIDAVQPSSVIKRLDYAAFVQS